jgi:hypothetical protein
MVEKHATSSWFVRYGAESACTEMFHPFEATICPITSSAKQYEVLDLSPFTSPTISLVLRQHSWQQDLVVEIALRFSLCLIRPNNSAPMR